MFLIEMMAEFFLEMIRKSAQSQSPSEDGSTTIYGLCWQMKALVAFIGGCCLVAFVAMSSGDASTYEKGAIAFVLGGFPTGILMLLPRRVITTQTEIQQKRFWSGETRIAWENVISIWTDNDGNATVHDVLGARILFSQYLVSQPRFIQEIKQKTDSRKVLEGVPTP